MMHMSDDIYTILVSKMLFLQELGPSWVEVDWSVAEMYLDVVGVSWA